ncbi:MAG TPA: copper chaperone PCu(A)C [Roseiarcus sp.]|jgi:periplasmic copper chaperone A
MRRSSYFPLVLAFAVNAAPALAQEFKAGDIVVEKPWARATPKGAEVGGGYLTIENNGAAPDRLTGGSADFATVEIHEMKSENGVMEMREVAGGLAIPARGSVGLAPGGYHLMFTHLTHALTKGDTVKATLTFEHAGPVEVEFKVMGVGAAGTGGAMGAAMKGMKM